jgi:transposase InsO family protein
MATDLVLDALMTAVWRRRPKAPVMIYSDEGSQFGSDDFNRLGQRQSAGAQHESPRKLLGQGGCRIVL